MCDHSTLRKFFTNVYQWELLIPQKFSSRRQMIYFMDSSLSMCAYMTFYLDKSRLDRECIEVGINARYTEGKGTYM